MSEIKQIMDCLGIGQIEGNVRGEHLGKILMYLQKVKNERFDRTMRVLPLVVGMQRRYIKENYVEGLIELGIIKLYNENNTYFWLWIGSSALNGEILPHTNEYVAPPKPKTQTKKGICPTCNKKIPKDKKFCNEECLRKYYEKNKGDKK